ncbi:hypothetical protein GCM10009106_04370 [Sphingomonas japonica]
MPEWVKPAPPIDLAKLPDDKPQFLIFDQQQRIEDGTVWRYLDSARAIGTAELLQQAGTITLPWAPEHGDLTIHRVEILRGAETIDLLKDGDAFQVIQREKGLEQRMLDGELTATMAVKGLRIGDVLRVAFSTSTKDPALAGNVQTFVPLLTAPARAAFGRSRVMWPEAVDLKLRAHVDGVVLTPTTADGFREVEVSMPLPKPLDMPGDAPVRFRPMPVIEATSFADWNAVSKVMAPLYATQGTIAPDSPIAAEVARIARATGDPRLRAGMALQTVQSEIRYLFRGMDGGNYVPQSPATTWTARYGDCKAKTLLLLAMLRALDIEAEAALVNTSIGDALPRRLPSAGMFDHVIVRATIGGEDFWLDGTGTGARPEDIGDTLPFGHALPLRTAGSGLMPVAQRVPERAVGTIDVAYDQRAGIDFPAPFKLTLRVRGDSAAKLQEIGQQLTGEQLSEVVDVMAGKIVDTGTLYDETIRYDDQSGYAAVTVSGLAYPDWETIGTSRRFTIDNGAGSFEFSPDRTRTAWKSVPVLIGASGYQMMTTTVRLPEGGKGFGFEGDPARSVTLPGITFARTARIEDGSLTVEEVQTGAGGEVAAAAIGRTRDAVARAKARPLRIVAEGKPRFGLVDRARKAGAFVPILAAYDADIAQTPDKARPYFNRAWFKGSIYDRQGAIDDLTRAIAIETDGDYYVARARHHIALKQEDAALADLHAAQEIDPGSYEVISALALLHADRGEGDAALDVVGDRASADDVEGRNFLALKADVLGRAGVADDALATIDQAVASSPRDANLLNQRCWLRGTLNVGLEDALKDCTRSIELGESPASALDSRAMVYFRMDRLDEALTDLNAALDIAPEQAASLYMRGVIARSKGNSAAAEADLAAARMMAPRIDEDYRRWGVVP